MVEICTLIQQRADGKSLSHCPVQLRTLLHLCQTLWNIIFLQWWVYILENAQGNIKFWHMVLTEQFAVCRTSRCLRNLLAVSQIWHQQIAMCRQVAQYPSMWRHCLPVQIRPTGAPSDSPVNSPRIQKHIARHIYVVNSWTNTIVMYKKHTDVWHYLGNMWFNFVKVFIQKRVPPS